jgi:uncharacterized protein (TIGR03084 family)
MLVVDVLADLVAEQTALDDIVAALSDEQWRRPTPSPGWTTVDQIAHLTYFDGSAAQAILDPEGFASGVAELLAEIAEGRDPTVGLFDSLVPDEMLDAWRRTRQSLVDAAATLAEDARVPWYGPPMGSKSFLTARLMEVWAHGQDIVDAVGASREPTDRLRHIAQLGVITRGWSYANRGLVAPEVPVRVDLVAPSGARWTWGDVDATESIEGPAFDFCLVVTQRRHVDDTALVVAGDAARDWMLRAQAFAGAPTEGPPPTAHRA